MKTKAKAKIRIDFKGYPGDDKIKNVCEKMGKRGYAFYGGGYNFETKKYDMTFIKKEKND